jgi:hypothetical protein
MVRNNKTYGILTTLRGFCFAFRQNQGQLFLTQMFAAHPRPPNTQLLPGYTVPTVTTMMALYYLSAMTYNQPDTQEIPPPGMVGRLHIPFASTEPAARAPVTGVRPPQLHWQIQPTPQLRCQGRKFSINFEPWNQENNLGPKTWLVDLEPQGIKAVMKLWESEDESKKFHEAAIYKRLESLWDICVPKFLGVDVIENSNSILIEYVKVSDMFSPSFINI